MVVREERRNLKVKVRPDSSLYYKVDVLRRLAFDLGKTALGEVNKSV